MKVSDLMLDLATGDASMHDVYIQEAYGKINVCSAVYQATSKIAELPKGEFEIIQEAADAGLPTDAEGACTMSCEAVKESLGAFYDLISASAKAVKQSCEKDLKLFTTIGKKYGVTYGGDGTFTEKFAKPLVAAIFQEAGGKKISLGDKKFFKGSYAFGIAESYCEGMVSYAAALGVNVTGLAGNPEFKGLMGGYHECKIASDFKQVSKWMTVAGKNIKFDKTVDKNRHYVADVKQQDLLDLIVALYVMISVSDVIIKSCGKSSKKTVTAHLDKLCEADCSNKKITKSIDKIGSNVKEWGEDVTNIVNNIKKAFSDSTFSFIETLNGGGNTSTSAE